MFRIVLGSILICLFFFGMLGFFLDDNNTLSDFFKYCFSGAILFLLPAWLFIRFGIRARRRSRSRPSYFAEQIHVTCFNCSRTYRLCIDSLVVPFSSVIGDFRIAVCSDAESTGPDSPDLIASVEKRWTSLEEETQNKQYEFVKQLQELLREGNPRWWKCKACGKVQKYAERDFVALMEFPTKLEGELALGMLHTAGINAILQVASRGTSPVALRFEGTILLVRTPDLDAAKEVLSMAHEESIAKVMSEKKCGEEHTWPVDTASWDTSHYEHDWPCCSKCGFNLRDYIDCVGERREMNSNWQSIMQTRHHNLIRYLSQSVDDGHRMTSYSFRGKLSEELTLDDLGKAFLGASLLRPWGWPFARILGWHVWLSGGKAAMFSTCQQWKTDMAPLWIGIGTGADVFYIEQT